ncbi:MAG: hypothetical protein ABI693_18815 [Bryobacteraceae bacterium]
MKQLVSLTLALAALAGGLSAVDTQTWVQSQQEEFVKGTLKNLSVRSDGRLFLAPVFQEIFDPSTAYLWALAEDSKGVLYVGGGGPGTATARLFQIGRDGKGKSIGELPGLEIHAIAIDSKDRVYAATSPDGKVYRVTAGAEPEVFYDPKAKYIWGMVFNRQGDLFIATGDTGEIHRVTPDGKGSVFFRTDETHARSMAIDAQGNLIVGTEPGGLILRISSGGDGFVLHQAAKREITAVAVAKDGSIYAAAVGSKPGAAPAPLAPLPPPAKPVSGSVAPQSRAATPPPTLAPSAGSVAGSEVYRIDSTGLARRVWSDQHDIVYAIGFDLQNRPILATGNKGSIYRIESEFQSTMLLSTPPTQITSLISTASGALYAVSGNIGKVYRIGTETEKSGTLESDLLDAGSFTDWGRLSWKGATHGGTVALETRSGNLDRPQKNWSPWTKLDARIASPSARFLQWRLTITGGAGAASPEVTQVEAAYEPRNIAPVVSQIEMTPPNYKFQPQSLTFTPSNSITLPPLGGRRLPSPSIIGTSSQTLPYTKGFVGARWAATDDNGDELRFTVEIRGIHETVWKKLKDNLSERYYGWDSTAFPDGEYILRITATDAPENTPDRALSAQLVGEPFTIDNTAPAITGLTATIQSQKLQIRWKASDASNPIESADYSVNGSDWKVAEPTTRLTDSQQHEYALTIDKPEGEVTVTVRVSDRLDNMSAASTVVK